MGTSSPSKSSIFSFWNAPSSMSWSYSTRLRGRKRSMDDGSMDDLIGRVAYTPPLRSDPGRVARFRSLTKALHRARRLERRAPRGQRVSVGHGQGRRRIIDRDAQTQLPPSDVAPRAELEADRRVDAHAAKA